jgi:hypothetical protein
MFSAWFYGGGEPINELSVGADLAGEDVEEDHVGSLFHKSV